MSNLKDLRLKKGLSQSKLAQQAEVSIRAIQEYEQGNRDINKAQAFTLLKLANILDCNIEDLME